MCQASPSTLLAASADLKVRRAGTLLPTFTTACSVPRHRLGVSLAVPTAPGRAGRLPDADLGRGTGWGRLRSTGRRACRAHGLRYPQGLGLGSLLEAKAGGDAPGTKSTPFQEHHSGQERGWGSQGRVRLSKGPRSRPSSLLQVLAGRRQAAASEAAVWPAASPGFPGARVPSGQAAAAGAPPPNRPSQAEINSH